MLPPRFPIPIKLNTREALKSLLAYHHYARPSVAHRGGPLRGMWSRNKLFLTSLDIDERECRYATGHCSMSLF